MARTLGMPKSTTEETWLATSGDRGLGGGVDAFGDGGGGDKAHDGGALGVAAEDHFGVGAVMGHGDDVGAGVADAVDAGVPLVGGGVVDGVDVEGAVADALVQGVDEGLAGGADAGFFAGAAGEDHLHVGTLGGGGGDEGTGDGRGGHARCGDNYCWTNGTNHVTRKHAAIVPIRHAA
ncbi:hypothetical protein MINTM011_49450 [Mycobacterium paraintracellulare]|nr:hypothetical protein MINTM011_49450 [Mycobacterium paraintracellulare]